jgi:hypothetical protein
MLGSVGWRIGGKPTVALPGMNGIPSGDPRAVTVNPPEARACRIASATPILPRRRRRSGRTRMRLSNQLAIADVDAVCEAVRTAIGRIGTAIGKPVVGDGELRLQGPIDRRHRDRPPRAAQHPPRLSRRGRSGRGGGIGQGRNSMPGEHDRRSGGARGACRPRPAGTCGRTCPLLCRLVA